MGSRHIHSTFQKLALSFLLLGVLPLLCVCLIFLRSYENSARLSIESNMEEANYFARTKVDDLILGIDRNMEALYDDGVGDFSALYEVLEDGAIRENERKMYVGLLLNQFIQSSPAVSAAYFRTPQGVLYSRFYSQQKSLRGGLPAAHLLPAGGGGRCRQLFLLAEASEAGWCNGSTDTVLTLARNYMDTRSLRAVTSTAVSYTHLDVYKRQVMFSASSSDITNSFANRTSLG